MSFPIACALLEALFILNHFIKTVHVCITHGSWEDCFRYTHDRLILGLNVGRWNYVAFLLARWTVTHLHLIYPTQRSVDSEPLLGLQAEAVDLFLNLSDAPQQVRLAS